MNEETMVFSIWGFVSIEEEDEEEGDGGWFLIMAGWS